MTVAATSTSARNDFVGNGVKTNFAFTFEVLNEANSITGKNYSLKVLLVVSGAEVEQVEDTDYTVTYDSDTRLGEVVFTTAPASSLPIIFLSDISQTQSTDYINLGTDKFPANSHEETVDKLTLLAREQAEEIGRAILLPESSNLTNVTIPVSVANANKAIVVNSSGDDLTTASLLDIDTYPITTFAETLLDDESSTEAMGTLRGGLSDITSLQDDDKFIVGDSSDSDNTKEISVLNAQGTTAQKGFTILPNRITVSNGTDTDHDIDFTAGVFNFDDGSGQAVASALTKQLDVTWASGSNVGGLADALTIAIDTTYYCFALSNADGSTVDFGFDTSLTAANLLADTAVIAAGLTKYKKIASLITDGSANILNGKYTFNNNGDYEFVFKAGFIADLSATVIPTGSRSSAPLTVPANADALIGFTLLDNDSITAYILITEADQDDVAPSATQSVISSADTPVNTVPPTYFMTGASSEVYYRGTDGGVTTFLIKTKGWKEVNL